MTKSISDNSPGGLDQQSRLLAKRLHELGFIYALYGALDGLSLSYSMFKYTFDLLYANTKVSSSDVMHEWLLTPEGVAIAVSSSVSMVVFSMLANHFKDDDKNQLKSFIATVWPYLRDSMKGLKNAYKGVRSAIQVAEILGGQNLRSLIVPVGVLLGVLAAANRMWMRYYVNLRKDMMKANAQLLEEIKNAPCMSLEKIEEARAKTKTQEMSLRRKMLLSAAYGGIVDGLYLYVGVLGLCTLAPTVFTAMTVFCAIYFLACIATRIYEEYDFQRRLVIMQAKIELALCGKELETQFNHLNLLALEIAKLDLTQARETQQQELVETIGLLRDEFEKKRAYLRELSTLSYSSAFLAGMKNGLAAYGALASAMFAVATVIVLASANFPPALLITCITLGMTLLIGFIAHSLIHAYRHQTKQEAEVNNNPHDQKLNEILIALKTTKQHVEELKPEKIKTAISDGMVVDPSPQFFFQEWFEVIRSFFSGLGKGSKAVDFTMNSFQERDIDGHYHDTPIMLGVTVLSAVVHASALALRAQARGFGKPPIDSVPSTTKKSETESCPTTSLSGELEPADQLLSNSPCSNSYMIPTAIEDLSSKKHSDSQVAAKKSKRSRYSFFPCFSNTSDTQSSPSPERLSPDEKDQPNELSNLDAAHQTTGITTYSTPATLYW
ncbi:hypothetical protein [Legionella cardiaca]|uniref:Transmembrane protein n=1 Tax=Legionella cardiaca TaxID=1071983 RepID=A0ABY8AQQ3_9GAMM|nr:hypothetical protein [Legionella cardiaca]WED43007.1 hypothetical protein PXX05_14075 [Legionella cardiaca]